MSLSRPSLRQSIEVGLLLALVTAMLVQVLAGEQSSAAKGLKKVPKPTIATKTSLVSTPNTPSRLEALCPKGRFPYGGGMTAEPGPGPDGEGIYPYSYERLGVQKGFHVTSVLFDPTAPPTTPRNVTIQAVCGPDPKKLASPRASLFVSPGQTQTVVATCPGGRSLISGGFQQTNFNAKGGDFVTQSQAVGNKAWSVTATAFGTFGGTVTAVANCARGKSTFQEVSASATIAPGATATASTPACPGGKRLVAGGFNTTPTGSVFFANGTLNATQSFSASGYNRSTAPATITGYADCLSFKAPKPKK